MAFPTICDPCRAGRHRECLKAAWNAPPSVINGHWPDGELWLGAAFCACAHGRPENAFQRSVREKIEAKEGES